MWSRDWIDVVVIVTWIGVWSALTYFVPISGV